MKTEIRNSEFKENGQNPFNVPDGYFNESRAEIMDMIRQEKTIKSNRIIHIRSRYAWISGIAATLLIGFVLFQNLYLKPEKDQRLAQELEWFLEYAAPEVDVDALAYYASEEGIDIEEFGDSFDDSEGTHLLELTEFDELYIIEEWMKSENQ